MEIVKHKISELEFNIGDRYMVYTNGGQSMVVTCYDENTMVYLTPGTCVYCSHKDIKDHFTYYHEWK